MSSGHSHPSSPFLTLGFRPFFLAAAMWSAVALALWIGMLTGGLTLPIRFDPLTWHIHEMLFGFVLAAIAGFLLTAIPNWTGRPPVHGWPLGCLALLWLAGRVAVLIGALLPLWLGAVIDIAFPAVLCAIAAREIILAHNRRNLPIPLPIALLGVANLLMYLELAGVAVPAGLGWRLAIAAIITLISVIGGRIIPIFTRNWLVRRGETRLPPPHGPIDSMALGSLHLSLLAWAFLPASPWIGGLFLLAALFNLLRLARWRGHRTAPELLLLSLHVGYFWIVAGSAFLGLSMLIATFPLAAAIHAFTAGAIGTMIVAVMTRVARGHTGRPLQADAVTGFIYALVTLSAMARVVAAFPGPAVSHLLDLSAGLWIASFLLFVVRYAPMLVRPRLA